MSVHSVSPGSYNSPSVQPQAQTQHAQKSEPKHEAHKASPPEHAAPTVNSHGQTVGTIINTKA